MEITVTDNFAEFNRNMLERMDKLEQAGAHVLREQVGLLCRTLINITPPTNRAKTAKKIDKSVGEVFNALKSEGTHNYGDARLRDIRTKSGYSDVWWYSFQPDAIFGVAKDKDYTDSSLEQLNQIYLSLKGKIGKGGRIIAGHRGKQRVIIWQKATTNEKKVEKLILKIKKRIGRLKAAWAVSWQDCGSPSGTLGPVQDWVMRHIQGAKQLGTGYSIDSLGTKGMPSFTIVNRAPGVSEIRKQGILDDALAIRAKAMAADLALYVRGVKHL